MRHSASTCLCLLLLTLPGGAVAFAGQRSLTLDPERTRVSFDLPATGHDVHGLLALESGVVRFDPEAGEAAGEIVLDAASAATGNASRDKTMHERVLETVRFPRFVFRPSHYEGDLAAGGEAEITLAGTLEVHGETRPLTLPGRVRLDGDHLTGTVRFPVPYVDWGMRNPSLLVLRVAKVVDVLVELDGTLESPDLVAQIGGPAAAAAP